MERFIAVFFAFVASTNLLLGALGQTQCSTSGTGGISGCECVFLGACDASGTQKAGLDISNHLPSGLELFGYAIPARNVAYLCEGGAVGILYDCNSRIPLYAATVIYGSQLSGRDSGGRPGNYFRLSSSGLDRDFQQSKTDYSQSSKRKICYKKQYGSAEKVIDSKWYQAKNGNKRPLFDFCSASDKLNVIMHKGHLVASQYGRGDQSKKKATFVFTNVVPQFGDFNSNPWRISEGNLVIWAQNNCASNRANVQMFILVGVIPSTMSGPSETRYFGEKGFSDYQDTIYRVNVPTMMWTAACCTFEYTDDQGATRTGTKSTAFWRENIPGNSPCNELDVNELARRLKYWIRADVNLFPYSSECNQLTNFIKLS